MSKNFDHAIRRALKHTVLAAGCMGILAPGLVMAQQFEILDLGPGEVSPRGAPLAAGGASAIANDDTVVGWGDYINPPPPAFQEQLPFIACAGCEGEFLPLPEGAEHGFAAAISKEGDYIVGHAGRYFDPRRVGFFFERGVLWDGGEARWLALPGPETVWRFTWALAVNDHGHAVGYSARSGAVLWQDENMHVLDDQGGSRANAINNDGLIVGVDQDSLAVIWDEGGRQGLGTLSDDESSSALAVNDNGQVIGWSGSGSGAEERSSAVLWENGALIDLGTLSDGDSSRALAINDHRQVAGWSGTTGHLPTGREESLRAFLWHCGQMHDLNSLIPGESGWELLEARSINNNGHIAGVGRRDGESRAFLLRSLTPVPDSCESQ